MKKLILLTTAASISLTMLGSLPLTAEAACRKDITVSAGCNQKTVRCPSQQDVQAILDRLQSAGCIVITSKQPAICWPGGNCNVPQEAPDKQPENQETPETPDNQPETGNQETGGQHAYVEAVVRLVNQERAKNGLQPLTINTAVQAAASVRAKEIQTSFSHTRPDGRSYSTALQEQKVSYRGSGENFAWGQKSPEQVMEGWMNSSGHRANILNPKFTTIGVGYDQGANGANYWTQLFTY